MEEQFTKPEKVLSQILIGEGVEVADLGSGSGHFTIPIAQKIGETGRIYSIDIKEEILKKLRKTTKEIGLKNVEIINGDIETYGGTGLKDKTVHLVFLINTLFQTKDKDTTISEAFRILKDNGRIVIMDWNESFGGIGPRENDIITKEQSQKICENIGFEHMNDLKASKYHYAFIARKKQ